jgi:hypothetical protein
MDCQENEKFKRIENAVHIGVYSVPGNSHKAILSPFLRDHTKLFHPGESTLSLINRLQCHDMT